MKHSILFVFIAVLTLMLPNPHKCSYTGCPFKEQLSFTSGCGNCLEGSDCWELDKIHFFHPSLDYDQCEAALFKPILNNKK